MAGSVANQQRLHERNRFSSILRRFHVRFYILTKKYNKTLYIILLQNIKDPMRPAISPILCPLKMRPFPSQTDGAKTARGSAPKQAGQVNPIAPRSPA